MLITISSNSLTVATQVLTILRLKVHQNRTPRLKSLGTHLPSASERDLIHRHFSPFLIAFLLQPLKLFKLCIETLPNQNGVAEEISS